MQRSSLSPDDYLASLPDDIRPDLLALDAELSALMAGRGRVLWEGTFWGGSRQSIIGYGDYAGRNAAGESVDWFAIGLARQKSYTSLYVNAVEDGRYLIGQYEGRLGKVKLGSANLQFRHLADVDRTALTELLTRARDLTASGA